MNFTSATLLLDGVKIYLPSRAKIGKATAFVDWPGRHIGVAPCTSYGPYADQTARGVLVTGEKREEGK